MQPKDAIAGTGNVGIGAGAAADGQARPGLALVDTLITEGVKYGLRLVGVLILIAAAWILAKWVRTLVYRTLHRPNFDETFVRFASNSVRGLVLLFAVIGSMSIFGIDTTSLAAVLGAAGVAIGLALQGSLSNIASGLLLLVIRPFVVGDVVKVAGVGPGKIDEIDLLVTRLDSPDNRRLVIPNSQIVGAVIENLTYHPIRRADVTVSLAATADAQRVREVLRSAAAGLSGVLGLPGTDGASLAAAPSANIIDHAGLTVTWQVSVWTRTADLGGVREALVSVVQGAIEREKLAPLPQVVEMRRTPASK